MRKPRTRARAVPAPSFLIPLQLLPLAALALLTALLLGGCNTVSGAGQDVEAVGHGIDTTSQSAEEKMFGPDTQQERRRGGY